jgi:Arc/MetJ family transcription regulator
MRATIELDDQVVDEAKEFTGISDYEELVNAVIARFVEGQEMVRAMVEESRLRIEAEYFGDRTIEKQHYNEREGDRQ